jgi:hypothetical protein
MFGLLIFWNSLLWWASALQKPHSEASGCRAEDKVVLSGMEVWGRGVGRGGGERVPQRAGGGGQAGWEAQRPQSRGVPAAGPQPSGASGSRS